MRLTHPFSKNGGFTLTETIVVIGLIAIMSSVGYSGFSSWQKRERVRSATYRFASYLKEARMKAIEKFCSHTISFTATQYTIFLDANNDFVQQNDEAVVHQVDLADLDPGITVSVPNAYTLRFDPRGKPQRSGGGFGNNTVGFSDDDGFGVNVVIAPLGGVTVSECGST